jgi:aconitase B
MTQIILSMENSMKSSILFCSLLVLTALPAFASEQKVVKSCSTVLGMPGQEIQIETKIDIVQTGGALKAIVTQNGRSYEDQASVLEASVQEGLNGELDESIDNLNLAEKLITHAISLTEDPIINMQGSLSAGMDLRKVRSAKVYTVGESTGMGLTAIVEAKDEAGKDLGSFFGGFLVSPCK